MAVLGITGPIFLLIGLGFAAVRSGLLAKADLRPLGAFVIKFALPALLFKAMALKPITELLDADLLAGYAIASLAVAGGVLALACGLRGRSLPAGVVLAMGASLSNSAFIGLPIAQQLIGARASATLALYVAVETLVMLPLLVTLAEIGQGKGRHWSRVLGASFVGLLKTPMIAAILAGVAFSVSGLELPLPALKAIEMLSSASSPIALFYIGGILSTISLRGMGWDIAGVVVGKLILHPLALIACFQFIEYANPVLKTAAIVNAGMPMMSIYPLLGQKYGMEEISSAALVAATAASCLTIGLLLRLTGAV